MLRRSDMPAIKMRLPWRIIASITLRFRAGRHGSVAARPVAPGSRVQKGIGQTRNLHGQDVVRRVHAGAAVEDGALGCAQLLIAAPERVRCFETTARVEVLNVRRAQRPREGPRYGVDR